MSMPAENRGTLCFLHGWGVDKRVWASFANGFLQEWNVKLPALPGYDGVAPGARGLEDVVRTLMPEIPDDSILIGWSLGGMIGIRIATMKPIRKLILLTSAPCFVKKDDWPCGTETETIESLMQRMKDNPERALQEFALLSSRGDGKPRATYQVLAGLLKENKGHPGALIDGLDMLLHTDLRTEFSRLKCKVGVILAANDQLLPVDAGAAMQHLRSGLELGIIEAAGHAPFISRPEQTRRSLLSMLKPATA
jgi:pimeloyl-[acyl-carrier protein] methyl ester esterase